MNISAGEMFLSLAAGLALWSGILYAGIRIVRYFRRVATQ